MDLELKNQTVLISGSGSGIGRGIAEGFLKEGSSVVLTGLNKEPLLKTEMELLNLFGEEKLFSYSGNLNNPETLQSLFNFIVKETTSLDHIVCNIGDGKSVPPLEENVEEFQRMLDINLLNAVGVINKFVPLIKKRVMKQKCFPSITFISSICGIEVLGCPVAYASAKSALISYAKNISFPLGREGVRVNVVSPGNIMFNGSTWEKKEKENPNLVNEMLKNDVPLKKFGTRQDIANAVVFLASGKAKFVNGANWVIDGGQTRS